jgi:hypothetical protein
MAGRSLCTKSRFENQQRNCMRPIHFHLNYMLGGLMVNAAAHIVVRKSRPSTLDADLSAGQLLAFVLYVYTGERRDRPAECYVINLIAVSVFLCTCREIEFSISLHARSTSAPHDNNQGLIHRIHHRALYIYSRHAYVSFSAIKPSSHTHTHKGQTRYYRLHITLPRIYAQARTALKMMPFLHTRAMHFLVLIK